MFPVELTVLFVAVAPKLDLVLVAWICPDNVTYTVTILVSQVEIPAI
jgi:hypothetical protein